MSKTPITLKNLHEVTPLTIFLQVGRHLLTQNRRAATAKGGCRYRTVGGLTCAAGACIADDEYEKTMENKRFPVVYGEFLDKRGLQLKETERLKTNRLLMTRLQEIHDHRLPERWLNELSGLANEINRYHPSARLSAAKLYKEFPPK